MRVLVAVCGRHVVVGIGVWVGTYSSVVACVRWQRKRAFCGIHLDPSSIQCAGSAGVLLFVHSEHRSGCSREGTLGAVAECCGM